MKTILQTPTPSLEKSISFYTQLGFNRISEDSSVLFSDGASIIEINSDRFARAGVKLYNSSWKEEVEKLEKLTSVEKTDGGYLLAAPSGTWIYLMESEKEFQVNLKANPPSVLGNNAGLSLETIDIARSITIWQLAGFTDQQGSLEQGWVTLKNNDGITISLMKPNTCPHLFFNPSLTFFNGKNNLAIIEKVKSLGIPITEEVTHFNKEGIVDNIIIRDPGGFGFFLFSD